MGKAVTKLLLLTLLAGILPGRASAQSAPLEIIAPQNAYANFLQRFGAYRQHLEKGEKALAKQELQNALEATWDGNLGDLPTYAGLVLDHAQTSFQNGDPELAEWLAGMAERLAPHSVEIQFGLSRYFLAGGPVAPGQAVGHYLKAARLLTWDVPALYRLLGRLFALPPALLLILGVALALVFAVRYLRPLAHDLGDFFPAANLPWWGSMPLGLVILLLPIGAGLSLWWLVSWTAMVLFLYLHRSERVLVFLWFALLLGMPVFVHYYSIVASNREDAVLQAAIRTRNGVPEAADIPVLEQALGKDPDNLLARMTLADLLTRQGRFNAAVEVYTPALKDSRVSQAAYNNVAAIYFAVGDLKSSYQALLAAQKAGPPRVEIPNNLGQYYQAAGQLVQMAEMYKKAQDLDEERAEDLRQRSKVPRLNRSMMPMETPFELIWEQSLRGSAFARQVEADVWNRWMGPPAGIFFQGASGVAILALFLLLTLGRNWRPARRCASCGRPICARCQRPAKDPTICSPCYNVFKGDGGVDLKIKMQKRGEVQRYRDLWTRLGLALALVVPGAGQLLLGFTLTGLVLFSLTASAAGAFLTGRLLWPVPAPVYQGGMSLGLIAVLLFYLALMIISVLIMRAKSDDWR